MLEASEKLNRLSDELEDMGVEMRRELDALEVKVSVDINGYKFSIMPDYFDISIKDLVDVYKDEREVQRLIAYLKEKYGCYSGVPIEYVAEETLLTRAQVYNYLAEVYDTPRPLFVDFEVVAEMVLWR